MKSTRKGLKIKLTLNSRKKLIEKVREKDTNQERGVREREREREAATEFTFSMFL